MSYGPDGGDEQPQILILDEGIDNRGQQRYSHGRHRAQLDYGTKIMHIDETNREYMSQEVGDEGSSNVINFDQINLDELDDNQNSSSQEQIELDVFQNDCRP